jgi:hypothetical protein
MNPDDAYNHSFEWALNQVKEGHAAGFEVRIARAGWNGKGMWVTAQYPDAGSKMGVPYLYMKTVEDKFTPWVISTADLFTDDWAIVESLQIPMTHFADMTATADAAPSVPTA